MPRVNRFELFFVVSTFGIVFSVNADDGDKKLAITDPTLAGTEFEIQGEYHGTIRHPIGGVSQVGLQIRSLGGGQFAAVEYPGGLPGSGWSRVEKFELQGIQESNGVWLASQNGVFIADGKCAKLISTDGRPLGFLPKVTRKSPTLNALPPSCAKVLFGHGANEFKNGQITEEGYLKWGTETIDAYRDFKLHVEFRLPYMPNARGQDRANSGIYLQSRYEVQVLDSFSLEGIENECGALYKTQRPDVNMCLPPLQWQTYDIEFRSPRFLADGETKACDGRITVIHNGVAIHNNRIIPNKTGAGKKEGAKPLPTKLQDHGNPVVFRNIWLIDRSPLHTVRAERASLGVAVDSFGSVLKRTTASTHPQLKHLFVR